MMKTTLPHRAVLIIFAVVLLRHALLPAQELPQMKRWNVNHRLQVAYEHDDNVYESISRPLDSPSLRLLYDARGRVKLRRFSAQMGYHGGCQFYRRVEDENKLINDLRAEVQVRVSERLQMGWQGWARLKLFLYRENDYAYAGWRVFAQVKAPAAVTVRAGYGEELLDYARTDFFSYYSPGIFLQARTRLGSHLTLSPQIQYASMQYRRYAFAGGDDNYSFWPAPCRQRDDLITLSLSAEGLWPALLLTLSYRYEMDESNSYGYSYHRHIASVSFVKSVGAYYFRGHATVQKKRYHDSLLPFYPLQLDTEREESNFIVLDVTRDLCSFMGLVLRAAWYQNESPWASLYYEKRLLSLGAEFRF